MFIRFSSQENINDYTPTATNTAGTQRLADGSKIIGAIRGRDAIYVWTDTSLFTMRFVGAPFTFGFEQVGTNCGLIGKNAVVEIDGAAFWLSPNGFFMFDGTVKSLPCSVEDFVFDDFGRKFFVAYLTGPYVFIAYLGSVSLRLSTNAPISYVSYTHLTLPTKAKV